MTWLSSSYSPRSAPGTMLWIALASLAGAGAPLSLRAHPGTRSSPSSASRPRSPTSSVPSRKRPISSPGSSSPSRCSGRWRGSSAGPVARWSGRLPGSPRSEVRSAILATQYSIGGGVEWGGRYFAVLVPVAVPVIVAGALPTLRAARPDRRSAVLLGTAAVVVTSTVAMLALGALRESHQRAEQLAEHIAAAAAVVEPPGGTPVVVMTSNRLLPQILYADIDRYLWVAASWAGPPGLRRAVGGAGDRRGCARRP